MMHALHWRLALGAVIAALWISAAGATDIDLGGPRWGSPTHSAVDHQSVASDSATASSVVFHVPTITCPVCPLRVEASIRKAPGILGVAFDGQDVTVTYDPSAVSPAAIEAAIEAGGDTAEPVAG